MKLNTLVLSNSENCTSAVDQAAQKVAPKHFKRSSKDDGSVTGMPVKSAINMTFEKSERPWGHYQTLSLGGRFQVKSIVVLPGEKLSLQSHHHRSEHWVVVEGTATVQVGDEEKTLTENQSIYIPLGAVHRLTNPGKFPMQLIEIQTGAYLGEDDIVRYEDVYDRV